MIVINLAKIHKSICEISCLQKLITDRQTDMTKYIISRHSKPGG